MKNSIKQYGLFKKEIEKILGNVDVADTAINVELLSNWKIESGMLILDNDYYYTISSYGSKGEKYYFGERDEFLFVMAYPEDDRWDSASIFILSLNNKTT